MKKLFLALSFLLLNFDAFAASCSELAKDIVDIKWKDLKGNALFQTYSNQISNGQFANEVHVLVDELMRSQNFYGNKLLYLFLEKYPKYTKQLIKTRLGDSDLEGVYTTGFLRRIGRDTYNYFVSNLGEKYLPLLIDPGILSRLEPRKLRRVTERFALYDVLDNSEVLKTALIDFVEFSKPIIKENPDISPFELRDLFSKRLGKIKVFRGFAVKNENISKFTNLDQNPLRISSDQKILKEELIHFFTTSGRAISDSYNPGNSDEDYEPITFGYTTQMLSRINGRAHYHDPDPNSRDRYKITASHWLSGSLDNDFAASVGFHANTPENKSNWRLLLYEANIPAIDVILQTGFFSYFRVDYRFEFGHRMIYGGSPKAEVFIPFGIDHKKYDVSVYLYDENPPEYFKKY